MVMTQASDGDGRSIERARAVGAGADARSAKAGIDSEGVRDEEGIGRGRTLRAEETPRAQGRIWPPAATQAPGKSRKASAFVPVRVVSSASVSGGGSPPTYRVLHPRGWPRLFQEEVVELTSEQLHRLMGGYDVWSRPHTDIDIHNSFVERQIKQYALGRKLWMFCYDKIGARACQRSRTF